MSSHGDLETVIGHPSASRRLSKLKRFLAGLQQDGPDSEQIQALIGDLVVSRPNALWSLRLYGLMV